MQMPACNLTKLVTHTEARSQFEPVVHLASLLRLGAVDRDESEDVQKLRQKGVGIEGLLCVVEEHQGGYIIANVTLLLELQQTQR